MELNNNLTMLISSCDKFLDLWDGHIELLNKNWVNRNFDTYLLTDKETDKSYENVAIISAGTEKEFSERLAIALEKIKTEYVFITLDDYFLIKPVSNKTISKLLNIMKNEGVDYLRLYHRPKSKKGDELQKYPNMYKVIPNNIYSVNLYAGIWKKSFLESTIKEKKNIWQYEVSLAERAKEYGANCMSSHNNEFVILDVVRKGKILRKANRYFKKYGIYYGNRQVRTIYEELSLGIKTWTNRLLPNKVKNFIRFIMAKFGYHFYRNE